MVKLIILSALAATASAGVLDARDERIVPMAMHEFKSECGANSTLHINPGATALLQQDNVPGAGIDKFTPFDTILKDGFMEVECVKDYMYYRGDKFGDNKHDYKLGDVSGVSIVHYDAFVAAEDKKEMTQKVCFEFCRTVPNMGFFGIVNGRGCYCTPYYKPMESDSSQCDSVCAGDNTLMCGGKSKSSVFAMHMCDSTKEDLAVRDGNAKKLSASFDLQVKAAKSDSSDMQKAAADLQKRFGAVGDSGATGLLQNAKVFAGELLHKAEDAETIANKLDGLVKTGSSLKDFTDPATVTKAERVMEGILEAEGEGKHMADQLSTLQALASGENEVSTAILHEAEDLPSQEPVKPDDVTLIKDVHYCTGPNHYLGGGMTVEQCAQAVTSKPDLCQNGYFNWHRSGSRCNCMQATPCDEKKYQRDQCGGGTLQSCRGDCGRHTSAIYKVKVEKKSAALVQYYPAMYWVDKKFQKMPMTCSGDLAAKVIVGQNKDGCAAACDTNIHSCVGFQFFSDGGKDLCFLLSNFKTGFYYTGCGSKAPFTAECYAKLSKFGTSTLKPNPSGKCKQCFTKLTKADRCYN